MYRLHIIKFAHLWRNGLLPVLFQSYFQYASSIHGIINNKITSPSFLRADNQPGAAELTVARRKRGRVV